MTSERTNEAMYNVLLNDDDFMESLDYMFEDFVSESDDLEDAKERLAEFISDELNDFCWLLADRYVEDTEWATASDSPRPTNRSCKGAKSGGTKGKARRGVAPKTASSKGKARAPASKSGKGRSPAGKNKGRR